MSSPNPFDYDNFNINCFRKWMKKERDNLPNKSLIGSLVESKISLKRLITRMETQEGDLEEVAKDFHKNGGTIIEENGYNLLIEVSTGNFLIHKTYLII